MATTIWSSDLTDGCDLPESPTTGYIHLTADGTVLYKSIYPIGGFQFDVDGAIVLSSSGGDMSASGLFGQAAGSTFLAFSLTGGSIPAGCGTLVNLSLSGDATGLSNIIFSDANAAQIYFEYYAGAILGCTDIGACNYNSDANEDDGSCIYEQENYDCAGNCTADIDCNGDCGGSADLDECGVCDGDNSSCSGCTDNSQCEYGNCACNYNSSAIVDDGSCSYPVDNFDCDGECLLEEGCNDCFDIPNGTAQIDACGECIDCSLYEGQNCWDHPAWNQSCIDCAGEINGIANIDACGNCVAPGTAGCILDCEGDFPFDVENYDLGYTNNCGDCYPYENGSTNSNDDCEIDCYGVWGGQAEIDDCGVCTGGSTELSEGYLKDCNGDCSGTAIYDNCGVCIGGNTGLEACAIDCSGVWGGNSVEDDCGVCGGDNSSCEDCAGVPNGDNVVDNCGTCDNDFSNDCALDCAGNWGGNTIEDQCGICGGDNSSCEDCAGVPNGDAIDLGCGCGEPGPSGCDNACESILVEDECGICGGDNSSCEDCAGVPNGDGELDECGVCDGDGIPDGDCDCFGNEEDNCGICGGDNTSCSWTDLTAEVNNINNIELEWDPVNTSRESRSNRSCSGEVCLSIENVDIGNGTLDIYMENSLPVAGYQFGFQNIYVLDATAPDGLTVSTNNNEGSPNVVAFSLTGSTIPPGSGFLTQISFDSFEGGTICFADYVCGMFLNQACNVVSDAASDELYSIWGGCACPAGLDECGVCGGDGTPDGDCDCYGNVEDQCGECGGDDSSCADCGGVPNGDNVVDNCGTCDNDSSNDCALDCDGDWGGDTVEDECGTCGGFGLGLGDYYTDCWNGEEFCSIDDCPIDPSAVSYRVYRSGLGIPIAEVQGSTEYTDLDLNYDEQYCYTVTYVNGGVESHHSDLACAITEPMPIVEGCMSAYACNYDENVTVDDGSCWFVNTGCGCENGMGATADNCGFCDLDPSNNCTTDCAGTWGGDLNFDECGVCGGNGILDGACDCDDNVEDECGVCGGDNSSCADCAGEPNGDNVVDNCGTCDNDSSNDCALDCAGNWGGNTIEDECGICGGDNSSCEDCAGVPNGGAIDLGCGCGEPGPSGCDYTCGSVAIQDECGVCGGDGSSCGSWTTLNGVLLNVNEIELSWDGAPTSDDNRGNRGARSNDLIDGCSLPESSTTGYLHLTSDGAVLYKSNADIGGFQFDVDGATLTDASGGAAAESSFTVSTSPTTALGFSLSGTTISAGCGTLVNLELDGQATGLSNLVISDANALPLYFEYYSCSVGEDCNGDCGGDAFIDNCDDCVGGLTGNEACFYDCAGVQNGSAIEDECGVCDGPGKTHTCWNGELTCGSTPDLGCPLDQSQLLYNIYRNGLGLPYAQVQNSTKFSDIGLNYEEQYCYTVTYSIGDYESSHSNQKCFITESMEVIEGCTSIYACNAGEPSNSDNYTLWDLGNNSSYAANVDDGSCWFSSTGCECSDGKGAVSDNCGECDADPSNNCTTDCDGVWGGQAEIDECGECDADPSNDCVQDCAGNWGGNAEIDECDVCGGDNGSCLDECGVVNGDDSLCSDCLGIPNGIAVEETMDSFYLDFWGLTSADIDCCGSGNLDLCGVCDGPGQVYECGCTGFPIDNSEGSSTYNNQACDCSSNVFSDDCGACGGTQYFKIFNVDSFNPDSSNASFLISDLVKTDEDCDPGSGREAGRACFKVENDELVLFEGSPVCDCLNKNIDVCGTCGGTEIDPSKCEKEKDCAGVLDGDSFEDNCGNCIGGDLALAGDCLVDGSNVTIPNLDSLLLISDLDYSNPYDFCNSYGECSIDKWSFSNLDTTDTKLDNKEFCEDFYGDDSNVVGQCYINGSKINSWTFADLDTIDTNINSKSFCVDFNNDDNNLIGLCSIDTWDFPIIDEDNDTTGTKLNTEELCLTSGIGECSIGSYNNQDDCECWGGDWTHSQWSSSNWVSSIWIEAVWDPYIAEDYSCEKDCADSVDLCNGNWVVDEGNSDTGACWGDPSDSSFGVDDCNQVCNGGAFIDDCNDCASTEEEACIVDCGGEDDARLNTCFYILKTSETDSTYYLDRKFDLDKYLEITQQAELEDAAETSVEDLCSTPTSSAIEELSYPYISYAYFSEDGSDECGVCGGDNFIGPSNTFEYGELEGECSCASLSCDCHDDCLSPAFFDDCGVCDSDPNNDCEAGCDGVPGSGLVVDCTGTCGGDAISDACGVCIGGICLSSVGDEVLDPDGLQYENEDDCLNHSGIEDVESIWKPGDIEFNQGSELLLEMIYVCEHPNIDWNCEQAPCWIENEGDIDTFEVPITKLDCQQIMNGIKGDWGIAGTEWDMLNQYGECDCEGNKLDCKGVCGGDDYSSCDNVDLNGNWCTEFDDCGICYGIGIKDGACDCFGNIKNCAGECPTITVEGVSIINPDWTPIDGEDLDLDGICDSDVNGNIIDPCVSLMSPHLIFELDENGAPIKVDPSGGKVPVQHGGYDVCGVCNGNGFSCGSEIKPGFEQIEIHWRKPFDNNPFIIGEDEPMGRAKSDGGSHSGGYGLYNNTSLNSSSSDAAVTVYLDNVDLDAGTLDIVTTNRPRCSYCSDSQYNSEFSCTAFADNGVWKYSETISENDCEGLNGKWFSGDIGGYQFTLLGVTVLNASVTFGFNIEFNDSTIIGFSVTGGTIPPGINQVMTTVTFAVDPSGTGISFGEDTGTSGSTVLSDKDGGYITTNWELPFCYEGYDIDDCGVCGGTGVQQACGCGEVGLMDDSGILIYELPDGACDCEEIKEYTVGDEKYMAGIPRYSSDRKQNFYSGSWSNSNYYLCWDKSTVGCFETDCPPDPGAVSFNVYRQMPIGGGADSLVLRESGLIYNSFTDEGLGYEQEYTYTVSYTYDNKEYFLTDSDKYGENQNQDEAKRLTATTDGLVPGCTFPSSCGYDNDNPPNFYMEGSCWWPSFGCSCTDEPGSIVDDCGVCDLNMDNDGFEDGCGVCDNNPDNDDATMDCAGVCDGGAVDTWCDDTCGMSGPELDACGNCGGTCECQNSIDESGCKESGEYTEGDFIICPESNKNIIDADCAGNCYDYVDPDGEDGDLPVSGTSLHGTCIGGWFGFTGSNIDQEECENTDGYWSEYGYDSCGECIGDSEYLEGSCLSLYNGLIPDDFSIHDIYPNPFNPHANIVYGIPQYSNVKITVYDVKGREVVILQNEMQSPGYYEIHWDASAFSSGVYFIEMRSGDFRQIKRVLHMK